MQHPLSTVTVSALVQPHSLSHSGITTSVSGPLARLLAATWPPEGWFYTVQLPFKLVRVPLLSEGDLQPFEMAHKGVQDPALDYFSSHFSCRTLLSPLLLIYVCFSHTQTFPLTSSTLGMGLLSFCLSILLTPPPRLSYTKDLL